MYSNYSKRKIVFIMIKSCVKWLLTLPIHLCAYLIIRIISKLSIFQSKKCIRKAKQHIRDNDNKKVNRYILKSIKWLKIDMYVGIIEDKYVRSAFDFVYDEDMRSVYYITTGKKLEL